MATLKHNDQEIHLIDGSSLQEPCMELGIPFGCQNGVCGTCRIDIIEGMEYLNPRTPPENDMELEGTERLACQCRIKGGVVRIEF